MADESIRSLLATLGFEVDTTGADQFEARFKKLESSVREVSKRISAFDPKFKKNRAPNRARKLGEKIKKSFFKGLRVKPGGFDRFTRSIKSGISKSFRVARIAAVAGAAAIAATIGKGLFKFTDVESAKASLRFQAENLEIDFDKILEQLEKVKENTKGVVDELDILQALNVGFQLTNNMEDVAENMEQVIKFSKVLNKDVAEVQQLISSFVTTGATTGLRQMGFYTQQELEAIKRSGTGFETLSESARTKIINEKLAEQISRLEAAFKKYEGTNAAFIAKSKTIVGEGLITLGGEITTKVREVIETDDPMSLIKRGAQTTWDEFIGDIEKVKSLINSESKGATVNQTNTIHINGGDMNEVKKALGEIIKDSAKTELQKVQDYHRTINK